MEKLVDLRLTWHLGRHGLLANSQCGFRKHRSTVDQLLTLDSIVRSNFKQGHQVGALFFDIEAAYDTNWRFGILQRLHKLGIRGTMGHFLSSYLCDRFFRVRVGNHLSERFAQTNGVPQGGALSLTLLVLRLMISKVSSRRPLAEYSLLTIS